MKATTRDFAAVGDRMSDARRHLKMTQAAFYDKFVGPERMTLRTYQRAETGASESGMLLLESFVRAGINSNWLLTGEGAMLVSAETEYPLNGSNTAVTAKEPRGQRINVKALAAIIEGAMRTNPNDPPDKVASFAASFYQSCIDQGMITPEGIGDGKLNTAA